MTYFAVFIIAMFITVALVYGLQRVAVPLQFMDMPDERKVHTKTVPRIGGVAMVLGALTPLWLWLPASATLKAFGLAVVLLWLFGIWDDRKNIHFGFKFLGQILAALIVVVVGGIKLRWLPFMGTQELPTPVSELVTVVALVGITNAMNLVDGLDGLAGGTTLLAFGLLGLLAYMANDPAMVMVALAIMGCILGFLRFNTHPASIFMGDCGSQFLGFTVGVLAVLLTQQVDVGLSPLFPIILLGLPVFDTAMVMTIRLSQGRSPFAPDKNHLHHRLLAAGFDHYEVVLILYILQGFLTLVAFALRYQSDAWLALFYAGFCGLMILALWWLGSRPGLMATGAKSLGSQRSWVADYVVTGAYRSCLALIVVSLPTVIVLLVLGNARVDSDIRLLQYGLLVGALVLLVLNRARLDGFDRILVYVWCSLAVYSAYCLLSSVSGLERGDGSITGAPPPLFTDPQGLKLLKAYFIALFILVIAAHQLEKHRSFDISTLDFLVIFISFSLPYTSVMETGLGTFSYLVTWLIILFYAVEFLINTPTLRPIYLRLVTLFLATAALVYTHS